MNPNIQGRISFYSKCNCEKCKKEVAELEKSITERQNVAPEVKTVLEKPKHA
jgi:peroxiredoxin